MKKCKLNKKFQKSDYDSAYLYLSNKLKIGNNLKFYYGELIVDSRTTFHLKFSINKDFDDTYEITNFLKILSTLPENSFVMFSIKNSNGKWVNKKISRYTGYNFSIPKIFKENKNKLILSSILKILD